MGANHTPPYLTDDEVGAITFPLVQGAARIKFFRSIGVKAEARPNGQPLVWRADFEQARRSAQAANDPPAVTQDWTDFEKRVRCGNRGTKAQRRQPARP